jgi:hypothetical protein
MPVKKQKQNDSSNLDPKLVKQVNRLVPRNYSDTLPLSIREIKIILPFIRKLEKERYNHFCNSTDCVPIKKKMGKVIEQYSNRRKTDKSKIEFLKKNLLECNIDLITREQLLYYIIGRIFKMLFPYVQTKIDLSRYTRKKKFSKGNKLSPFTILDENLKVLNKAVEEAVKKSGLRTADQVEQKIFNNAYKYGLIEKKKGDHTTKFERIKKVNKEFGSPLSKEYLENNKDDLENRMQAFEQKIIKKQLMDRKRK